MKTHTLCVDARVRINIGTCLYLLLLQQNAPTAFYSGGTHKKTALDTAAGHNPDNANEPNHQI